MAREKERDATVDTAENLRAIESAAQRDVKGNSNAAVTQNYKEL